MPELAEIDMQTWIALALAVVAAVVVWKMARRRVRRVSRAMSSGAMALAAFGGVELLPQMLA